MYAQGIEIYRAPTVDDRDMWAASMRHIAVEGRCFVLSSAQYLTRADCPSDYEPLQGNHPETVLIRGGSSIIGPLGEELVSPVYGRESVLVADLDMSEILRAKFDFDAVGHYARPDIFEFPCRPHPAFSTASSQAVDFQSGQIHVFRRAHVSGRESWPSRE